MYEFKCCTAGDSQCASCRSEGVIRLNTDNDGGFIGSVVVDDRQDDDGCGTSRCPWVIRGQPGQVSRQSLTWAVCDVQLLTGLHGYDNQNKKSEQEFTYTVSPGTEVGSGVSGLSYYFTYLSSNSNPFSIAEVMW